ncbi:MAG: NAD-binding protein, partial [Planctomycetota bacterium]
RSVSGGAAGSWSLSNLAPRMLKNDFAPGFYVDHFLKDLRLALSEADRMQLCLPGLALAKQLYQAVAAAGGGRDGTQALVRVIADLAGRSWKPKIDKVTESQ